MKIFKKKEKIAIVVQGPSLYVEEVKNAWKDFKNNLIFSTWKGSENEYDKNDIVIFNDEPQNRGYCNFNLQKISSYYGLLKAKSLGYTHAIKIRSDYIPTNAKKFISILKLDKLNFLLWEYTSFLWLQFPTFNGYFADHIVFGPIDEMIELWDIKDNFCSTQTLVTWSYVNKLRNKIDIHYFLPDLNKDNDLFYMKSAPGSESFGFYSYNNDFGRNLKGRYESYFQNFLRNSNGHSEYTKTPEETKKFMNDKYLNFLKYYNPLPKITIIDNTNKDFKDIIYPINKIEIVSNINNITGDYVILSEKITSNATIMIEYLKKIKTFYNGVKHDSNCDNPGNFSEPGYKKGTESDGQSDILTIEEFYKNNNK